MAFLHAISKSLTRVSVTPPLSQTGSSRFCWEFQGNCQVLIDVQKLTRIAFKLFDVYLQQSCWKGEVVFNVHQISDRESIYVMSLTADMYIFSTVSNEIAFLEEVLMIFAI